MTISLPTGFTARPATVDDLAATVDLMNAVTQLDGGKSDTTVEYMQRYWQGDDLNLTIDTFLVHSPDGRLAGMAQFIADAPPSPYDTDTWTHPDFAESGVGEALLQWIDERAAQAMTSAPAGEPVSIEHVYIYSSNVGLQRRLEKSGYRRERIYHRMQIDFNGALPEPRLANGITIRSFRRGGEERAVYAAFAEAQADEWGQEDPLPYDKWLYYFIETEPDFDPGSWFLAVEGDTIVGYALCRWTRAGQPDHCTVRYLAVRRAWRKRGIALALLHAAFGEMQRRGYKGAGLGVDATSYTGADRLYLRAGMHVAAETLRYRKVLRDAK
ncbi:MAG: GNAT family N-acetyltransferase [Chloroflexi bacterium]|nr:GNAT family N-acetyltransferase [Chloroflexota bacterium]